MTVDTKDLVTTIAYFIGARKHTLEQCFDAECHDTLQKLYGSKEATVIRYLCKLRTTLFQKFKNTNTEMMYNLKNLDRLEWYDHDNIKQLEKCGISVIKPNYRAEQYMVELTRLISENIDKCSTLFYDWVNWTPVEAGSILYTDGKFLGILYKQHNDHFDDYTKYRDAHSKTKNSIYDFVKKSNRTALVVDCENSDVYKLFSVLRNLNTDELDKIEKIYLYDDYHTSAGWDWLYQFTRACSH